MFRSLNLQKFFQDTILSRILLVQPPLVSSGRSLFLLLDQPALLSRSGLTGGRLALDLDFLALVGTQLVGEVGLLGRLGSLRDGELLDVGFGVTGLGGGRLVSLDLTEVELLDGVRCKIVNEVCSCHFTHATDYSGQGEMVSGTITGKNSSLPPFPLVLFQNSYFPENSKKVTYPGWKRKSGSCGER